MIMTSDAFHKRKNIFRSSHKNPIANDLYKLLQAYESAQTPNRELKLIVLMYFLCLEYQHQKFGAKNKTISKKDKENNLVLKLKDQLEAEVTSQSFQQAYQNKLSGLSFKNNVQRTAPNQGGTKLKDYYGVESIAPQANTVSKYALSTRVPAFGMSLLTQEMESDFQVNHGMDMSSSGTAAHNKLANMSLIDMFKELHKLWRNVNVGNMTFSFLDSDQRSQYLATCANGVWSCNNKHPFNTGKYPMMYAMSMNHELYIPDGRATGGGNFNHSSLLSGKPVLCAGTLTINQSGVLTYIDNDSGHYKPDTNALKDVVKVLIYEFKVNQHRAEVFDKATGVKMPMAKFNRS